MNKRLASLLAKIEDPPGESVILDCYNQAVVKGAAMTVTTRIDAANMYYLLEKIDMEQNTDKVMQVGNAMDDSGRAFKNPERGRVFSSDGLSPTLKATMADRLVAEPTACAMRGRGNPAVQHLEMGGDIANCVTTVEKDSMVAVPVYGEVIASLQAHAYVGSTDGVSPTLPAAMGMGGGHTPMITELAQEPLALGYSRDSEPGEDGKYRTRRHFSEVANTVCASSSGTHEALVAEPVIIPVGNIYPSGGQGGKVVDPEGLAPAVCECHGEVTRVVESPILVKNATKQGFIECPAGGCFDPNYPGSSLRRGRVQENGEVSPALTAQGEPPWLNEGRVVAYKEMPDGSIRGYDPRTADKRGISEEQYANPEGVAPTVITAHEPKVLEPARWYYRIRKLHPIETFRLMDVDDEDISKMIDAKDAKGKPALSKSACYKLAGNSIVTNCLALIFESLLFPAEGEPRPQPMLPLF